MYIRMFTFLHVRARVHTQTNTPVSKVCLLTYFASSQQARSWMLAEWKLIRALAFYNAVCCLCAVEAIHCVRTCTCTGLYAHMVVCVCARLVHAYACICMQVCIHA